MIRHAGLQKYRTKINKFELRQFQYMTANEVIQHHRMNDKIQEMNVSCVYLSIHSKFWVIID